MRQRTTLSLIVLLGVLSLAPGSARADQLAFLRQGNIWVSDTAGGGAHQITTDGGYAALSAAKGSGRGLLGFRQNASYGVIRADGSARQVIPTTGQASAGSDAKLNPAGTRLAYTTFAHIGCCDSSLSGVSVKLDGSDRREFGREGVLNVAFANAQDDMIYSEEFVRGTNNPACYNGSDHYFFYLALDAPHGAGTSAPDRTRFWCRGPQNVDLIQPAVSPDFSTIVAAARTHCGSGCTGPPRLVRIAAAASDPSTDVYLTPDGMPTGYPDWSTDASTVVFQGTGSTIWTVPSGGGQPSKILDDATMPAWIPTAAPPGGGGPAGPKPTVSVGKIHAFRGVTFKLAVTCPSACTFTTRGSTVQANKKTLVLRTVTRKLAANRKTKITAALPKKQQLAVVNALLNHRMASARLVLTAYYADGTVGGPITRNVRLVP
jgi:hypothetical protein